MVLDKIHQNPLSPEAQASCAQIAEQIEAEIKTLNKGADIEGGARMRIVRYVLATFDSTEIEKNGSDLNKAIEDILINKGVITKDFEQNRKKTEPKIAEEDPNSRPISHAEAVHRWQDENEK